MHLDCSNMQKSYFIISLDFELYWGVFDKLEIANYGEHIKGVHEVIPRLLTLFTKYDIAATWATVGFLLNNSKDELLKNSAENPPKYKNTSYSAYAHFKNVGEDLTRDPYHFCGDLIKKIKNTPKQEIASHTYSHYYCLEEGQNKNSFYSDCKTFKELASKNNIELKSLVFPRNQYNKAYLEICKEMGITSYRGIQKAWIYKEKKESEQSLIQRFGRLLNNYIALTSNQAVPVKDLAKSIPLNLPATRFLRPYSQSLSALESLRLKRIKREMTLAAQENCVYHLWWHPHNFGQNINENFKFLSSILDHYKKLNKEHQFESITMEGLTELLLNE